jgi:hypothetical protein
MSVTLSHAAFLTELGRRGKKNTHTRSFCFPLFHLPVFLFFPTGLHPDDVLPVADLFRAEGVRRVNVLKNTGGRAYAFNAFQRSVLPPTFAPPAHLCGTADS